MEFTMFSRIVFIVFFVQFIVCGSGMVRRHEAELMPGAFEPVMKCYKAAGEASNAVLEAMAERPETDADKIDLACLSFGLYGPCLVAVIKATYPVPNMFHFFAAMEYQHNVLLKKAGLCRIPYEELRKIALGSGIMKHENLVNIENVDYAKCAGEASRKCIIKYVTMFEHQVNLVTTDLKYIECMENEAKTCTAPIMKHFMELLEKDKELLKRLPGK